MVLFNYFILSIINYCISYFFIIIFVYFCRVVTWGNNNNADNNNNDNNNNSNNNYDNINKNNNNNNNNKNNNNKTKSLIFMVFGKALLKICFLKQKMVIDTKINITFKKE